MQKLTEHQPVHHWTMSPRCPIHTDFLNTSTDGDSTTSLGSLFHPFNEETFSNIWPKSLLVKFEAISSFLISCHLEEKANPHLNRTSCQGVVESEKVPMRLLFLQAEHTQIPQPFLIKPVLQFHSLLTWDMLQDLHVFLVMQGTKLDTEFEVQPEANIQLATWRPGLFSISCRLNIFRATQACNYISTQDFPSASLQIQIPWRFSWKSFSSLRVFAANSVLGKSCQGSRLKHYLSGQW